jgi:16S rRNA (guanine527-N7)-methyltransferase
VTPVVPRETGVPGLPEPPAAAAALLGDRLDLMASYAELLATTATEWGLLGPREVPRLWERHLLNCAVVAELLPEGVVVDDLGSGAGLPGLVLAIQRPDLRMTLIEPLLRRATFLTDAVAALGLANVRVQRARAEELRAHRGAVDVVTARAVAPLGRLAGWALPLLRPGGVLLALKGSSAAVEVAEQRAEVERYGATAIEVLSLGVGVVDPPTTVVRVGKGRAR